MNEFFRTLDEMEIYAWETFLGDWVYILSFAFLAFELVRYFLAKRLNWNLVGDTITNFITLAMFYGMSYVLFYSMYLGAYLGAANFAMLDIPVSWASIVIAVVLADLAYYWEHRFLHRVNVAWATHTVHHSSPHFNISVAYRFGPMDGFWPVFFHVPLIVLGFNPFIIFFAEMFVQLYQTILHTETIKKLPRPIEYIMNTPSHHRVHHGSNPEYLDKNYAGIFIIWDRMFGTFAEEKADVKYGLVEPINSINPLVAFFHGFWRLGKNISQSKSLKEVWMHTFAAPDWRDAENSSGTQTAKHPAE